VAITSGQQPGAPTFVAPSQGVVQRQIVLLESENVVRRAIDMVGAERIAGGKMPPPALAGILTRMFSPLSFADATYVAVRNALSVVPAPQTDFIRVFFRHRDPQIAVEFTNALVRSFTDRYFQIYSNSYAVAFFSEQKQKSEEAFAQTSA